MDKLQEALDRAFPVFQMGGLSGAMYPADEGEGQGWAISNEDWEVVAGVVRELIEDPVAVVRRGVESGTIKGEVVWWCQGTRVTEDGAVAGVLPGSLAWQNCFEGRIVRHKDCGWRLSIPVSDGGSET